jgi:hypothetical protein
MNDNMISRALPAELRVGIEAMRLSREHVQFHRNARLVERVIHIRGLGLAATTSSLFPWMMSVGGKPAFAYVSGLALFMTSLEAPVPEQRRHPAPVARIQPGRGIEGNHGGAARTDPWIAAAALEPRFARSACHQREMSAR